MVNRRNSLAHRITLPPSPFLNRISPLPYAEPRTPSKPMSAAFFTSVASHHRSIRSKPHLALLILLCGAVSFFALQALLRPSYSIHDQDSPYSLHELPSFIHAASRFAHNASGRFKQPQLLLDPPHELAAVTAFVAAGTSFALPRNVDPSKPIDPQLVLDFDTARPNALQEVESMAQDTWFFNPVVLYVDGAPQSKDMIDLFTRMNLHPSPTIVDLDARADADVLRPILFRLTESTSLPIILVGGAPLPVGDVEHLHQAGELRALLAEAGASSEGSKRPRFTDERRRWQ